MTKTLSNRLIIALGGLLVVSLGTSICRAANEATEQAQAILDATDVQGGIVVNLGC